MEVGGRENVRFGDFEFDLRSGKLFRGGRPVKIQPQPLRVLAVLLERAGEIVSRESLRSRVWGDATFVEFDQGLNYCIRQIRLALRDGASKPLYIETLPKQGYRFIARVEVSGEVSQPAGAARAGVEPAAPNGIVGEATSDPSRPSPVLPAPRVSVSHLALGVLAVLAIGVVAVYPHLGPQPNGVKYTQLTDFTDSALAPALSPDGRMVAFIRGSSSFLTADQVYVKVLPNGEAKRLTDDSRLKYGLAFTPDGTQVAYTVLQPPSWSTYTVSVLGGDSHLFLNNAAGLTWLDQHQLLFSRIRSGQHMGIVTGTAIGPEFRERYFPRHERAMAHYSAVSPDHRAALVVEMDENGQWAPCRLISLNGRFDAGPIGPPGPCTSVGWSPDGSWMYFTASVDEHSHLWRQRFPGGEPELITPGPIEAEGVAVEKNGRSIITSMGVHESSIWIHDLNGERSLSSEGEIVADISRPSFAADDSVLYYLLRHGSDGSGPELWRMTVDSGKSEAVFPGVSMIAYDVSPDGKQVVYAAARHAGTTATVARPCRPKLSSQANRRFRRNTAALWTTWADLVSSDRGKLQLPGTDEPGRFRAFEGGPLSHQYDSKYLARTPMDNGPCSRPGEHRSCHQGDSARWRNSADHMRRFLYSGMVLHGKVSGGSSGSAFADQSRKKPGDSGWVRRGPARTSARRDRAAGESQCSAGSPIDRARRTRARQGPRALCVREYHGASESVSNFAAMKG